jgi:3-oxocholest-4-en-26-oyl-CoA dehydrogenase beta subunit
MDFTFSEEQETIAKLAATAQQVHGGIGIDISYPLHRYFLWAKHNELALGPAAVQLARLGATDSEGLP